MKRQEIDAGAQASLPEHGEILLLGAHQDNTAGVIPSNRMRLRVPVHFMEPQTHDWHELMREIEAIKERLRLLESTGTHKRPTIESVRLQCAKIGLPMTEADNFWNHYESNGWKVGKNPMCSWQAALVNWKKTYEAGIYRNGANGHAHTPQALKTIISAKETVRQELRDRHSSQTATGRVWNSPSALQRAKELSAEIRELTNKLAQST